MSSLSHRSVDALLDLVEIKLSCLEVFDREDAREKSYLETARRELRALKSQPQQAAANLPAGLAA